MPFDLGWRRSSPLPRMRHVRRGAGERVFEDRLEILIVSDEERRIAEVHLPVLAPDQY